MNDGVTGGGGWAPDPTGRYRLRWWDGHGWTAYVSSGTGGTYTDPLGAGPAPTSPAGPPGAPHPMTARPAGPAPASPMGPPPVGPPPVGPPPGRPAAGAPAPGGRSAGLEQAKAPGLAGAGWPVVMLVSVGLASILSGLLRALMFGSDADPGRVSAVYLILTYALSFGATLAVTSWVKARRGRSLRGALTGRLAAGAVTLLVAVVIVAPQGLLTPVAGAQTDTTTPAFDYSKKFAKRVYVVVATREGNERLLMMPNAPVGDLIDLPDGEGGTVTVEVVSTTGPFRNAGAVCSGTGGLKVNGRAVTSFGWEERFWDCKDYEAQGTRTLGTIVFGVLGLALIGFGASAGSAVAVGLGIGSAAYAAYIWLHGAPKPMNVQRVLEQMIRNSKQVKAAQQAATDLETAMRGHMSEKELREAADFTEKYLVRLTEKEKADFYTSQGVPVESLLKQVKELKQMKDW